MQTLFFGSPSCLLSLPASAASTSFTAPPPFASLLPRRKQQQTFWRRRRRQQRHCSVYVFSFVGGSGAARINFLVLSTVKKSCTMRLGHGEFAGQLVEPK